MPEGFWEGWGHSLFNWKAFVFTIAGTIVALVLVREYWWVSVLIVMAVYLASGRYAYAKHRGLQKAEQRHHAEIEAVRLEARAASDRVKEVERRLAEVPSDILQELQAVIRAHSHAELARVLLARADFIGRMRGFTSSSAKPINLRTFTRQGDKLYAVAKADSTALSFLRVGDPFLLVRRSADGLETPSARLVVHQAPEAGKEVVMFEIADYLSDEMEHLDSLAHSGDAKGIRGYAILFACDLAAYEGVDFQHFAVAIARLVDELAGNRGGVP